MQWFKVLAGLLLVSAIAGGALAQPRKADRSPEPSRAATSASGLIRPGSLPVHPYFGLSGGFGSGTNLENRTQGTNFTGSLLAGAYWDVGLVDVGVQGRFNFSALNLNPNNPNNASILGGQANLLLKFPFGSGGKVSVFAGPGFQVQREATPAEAKTAYGPNVLAGLEYRPLQNVGMFVEGRGAYLFNDNVSFRNWRFGVGLGVLYYF